MTREKLTGFLCSAVLAAMFLPQAVFAQGQEEAALPDYQDLSQYETQTLLDDLVPQALTDTWIGQITSGDSDKFSSAVAATLRGFVRQNFTRYLLTEVPLDAAKTVILQGVEIGKIVYSKDWDDAMAGILEKFEKDSAAAAVDYVKGQFAKYETKMATGAFEARYESDDSYQEKALIQYVLVYKPDGDSRAGVSIRFYSINEIIPPKKGASFGLMTGVVHDLEPGEMIPPFVATFSGDVEKARYGGTVYSWDGNPEVDISFPDSVTDFGFRPVSWWDKNVVNPIKGAFASVGNFFGGIGKSIGKLFGAQMIDTADTEAGKSDEAWFDEQGGSGEQDSSGGQFSSLSPSNPASLEGPADKQSLLGSPFGTSSQEAFKFLSEKLGLGQPEAGDSAGNNGKENPPVIQNGGSEKAPIISQMTDQERQEALKAIALELARRQQEEQERAQAEEEDKQLRTDLIAIIGELQRRAGPSVQADIAGQDDETEGEEEGEIADGSDNSGSSGVSGETASLCAVPAGQSALMSKIIINEVAWMGSQAGSTHEWIELRNITDQAVNLDGWQVQDKDRQIKLIFDSESSIGAKGFFLLERTSDDAVPGIKADAIYKGSLANSNEALYLFSPDCQLQDKVEAVPYWPAGNDSQKRSMERGSILSWHTYAGIGRNNIFGTPKEANGPAAAQSTGGGGSGSSSGGSSGTGNSSSTQQQPSGQTQNPEPDSEPQAADHLLISEIMLADSQDREYVELYNPTDQAMSLCAETSTAFYFSYYSSGRDWNNPYRVKSFCDSPSSTATAIPPKGYYLIGFNGYPQSDWPMYSSDLLSDNSGAVAVFSGDPRNATGTVEETASAIAQIKADAVGWKQDSNSADPLVREGNAALIPDEAAQALGRLWHIASQKYQDTDDNSKDFGKYAASPGDNLSYAPEAIADLSVDALSGKKNGVRLSWPAPNDKDSEPSQLDYRIFFVRGQAFSTGTMAEMEDEVNPSIVKADSGVTADIFGLYYGETYHFAVQAEDEEGNLSPLSSSVQFGIDEAIHPWPMAYHDAGVTNKSDLAGPIEGSQISDFAGAGDFFSPPAIDENGSVYFTANIGGQSGIFAYDSQGRQEWFYNTGNSGRVPALNNKGLVYFFASYGVGALSPAGRFKWSENFSSISSRNPVAGPDGNLYLIAKTESQEVPHLLALADGGTQAVKQIDYDLSQELPAGEQFLSAYGPALDSQGNVYLAINGKILKFSGSGQKLDEKIFEPDYDDDYEGSLDVTALPGLPQISGDSLITVVANGHCGKLADLNGGAAADACESTVYSVALSDFDSENWKKNIRVADWAEVMGSYLFYISRACTWLGSCWQDLNAVRLDSGDAVWTKHWPNDFGYAPARALFVDSQNRAYLAQGNKVLGYDIDQVLDNSPDSGLVFSAEATHSTSNGNGGSLGNAGMFMPARDKMNLIHP